MMRQPPKRNQRKYLAIEKKIVVVLVLLVAGNILLFTFLGLRMGDNFLQPILQQSPVDIPETVPPQPTVFIPTVSFPTPECGIPTLTIGSFELPIESFSPALDGLLVAPAETTGIAYWVQGTDVHPVFVLSPSPDNLSLLSLVADGSEASVTWGDCNTTIHSLAAPVQGTLNFDSLPAQDVEGITIFFQGDQSGNGYLLAGEMIGEEITLFDLLPAAGDQVEAEISLLEVDASSDGTTLRIGVSILNYGAMPFMLTVNDVALTPEGSLAFFPLHSQPGLPREIKPGSTETFTFTFPRPPITTATLRVFTVEYDIDGY